MTETNSNCGFKIKWGNIEIEYFGEKSQELFREVFSHVKQIPAQSSLQYHVIENNGNKESDASIVDPNVIGSKAYDFITKDSKQPIEKVTSLIKFEKNTEFPELVPFLPSHPEKLEDAIVLVSYAIQVGLQKAPLNVVYIKKILKAINGYPLTGNEFGVALGVMRGKNYIAASQTKGLYKPYTLVKDGIERARTLLSS